MKTYLNASAAIPGYLTSVQRKDVYPELPHAYVRRHWTCMLWDLNYSAAAPLLQHDISLEEPQHLDQGSATIMPLYATTAASKLKDMSASQRRFLQTATCMSASPIPMHPIGAVYTDALLTAFVPRRLGVEHAPR